MGLSRRSFVKGLLAGAASLALPVDALTQVAAPERRVWQLDREKLSGFDRLQPGWVAGVMYPARGASRNFFVLNGYTYEVSDFPQAPLKWKASLAHDPAVLPCLLVEGRHVTPLLVPPAGLWNLRESPHTFAPGHGSNPCSWTGQPTAWEERYAPGLRRSTC